MTTDFQAKRRALNNNRAQCRTREQNRHYNRLLRHYFSHLIPPGARVLEIGCGVGDLLAAVKPATGVGIDFSERAIEIARARHPDLEFYTGEAESFSLDANRQQKSSPTSLCFDYIILSDLVNDLDDVQAVLEELRRVAHPRTRVILNFFNNVWRPILSLAEALGFKAPSIAQNWLSSKDMRNLLALAGWEVIVQEQKILCPVPLPVIAAFLNRFIAPVSASLCLTIFQVARMLPSGASVTALESGLMSTLRSSARERDFTCSVIIPARNEMGNIESAVKRLPEMGARTEIIFIEGHSKDATWAEINRVADAYPHRSIKVLKQKSKGKGGAVREAFEVATGDIVMILDADLTVPPEDLPKFFDALKRGRGEFINGVRLVYPLEERAMQFLNMIANKLFGFSFSWLIRQPIKDTLCGTKALFRRDYQEIARNRDYFGDFDPFGDFDLLFGAARMNLRIVDMPVRYRSRTYGETNIQRWRHGALLLRMVLFGAGRLRFL